MAAPWVGTQVFPDAGAFESCLVCRHLIGALQRSLHGPDMNAQSVGNGFIVETTAVKFAYTFPAFISTLSSRGGARLPCGRRHDLRR